MGKTGLGQVECPPSCTHTAMLPFSLLPSRLSLGKRSGREKGCLCASKSLREGRKAARGEGNLLTSSQSPILPPSPSGECNQSRPVSRPFRGRVGGRKRENATKATSISYLSWYLGVGVSSLSPSRSSSCSLLSFPFFGREESSLQVQGKRLTTILSSISSFFFLLTPLPVLTTLDDFRACLTFFFPQVRTSDPTKAAGFLSFFLSTWAYSFFFPSSFFVFRFRVGLFFLSVWRWEVSERGNE